MKTGRLGETVDAQQKLVFAIVDVVADARGVWIVIRSE
jgi:hypothetical protein